MTGEGVASAIEVGVRHDDELKYAWLFRAYFPDVLRTVTFILHDRGPAEEVAQEAFIKLFQNWRTVSRYERSVFSRR